MPLPNPLLPRRRLLLQHAGLLAAGVAAPAWAQSGKSASRSLIVAQVVDFSQAQQDVSKDFLIGSRAAWQDINTKGGIRGRTVHHQSIEVDGSAASVIAALASIKDNASCVALSGTAGDPAAALLASALRQEHLA